MLGKNTIVSVYMSAHTKEWVESKAHTNWQSCERRCTGNCTSTMGLRGVCHKLQPHAGQNNLKVCHAGRMWERKEASSAFLFTIPPKDKKQVDNESKHVTRNDSKRGDVASFWEKYTTILKRCSWWWSWWSMLSENPHRCHTSIFSTSSAEKRDIAITC